MKRQMFFFWSFVIVPIITLPPAVLANSQHKVYQRAVQDASLAESGEIARNLVAITPDNSQLVWNEDHTKILVATWKSHSSYENFIKDQTQTSTNQAFVVWVTTVPQVQQFCQAYIHNNSQFTAKSVNLRLKQYLGLHFSWQYDVFIEMWVNPEELFRPCVDPEIRDAQCQLTFGDSVPIVKNIQDYPTFYKNLYFQDFRQQPGVPWTGLGYTYDWGNPLTEQGASEFILIPGAMYEIKRVVPTMDYCKE